MWAWMLTYVESSCRVRVMVKQVISFISLKPGTGKSMTSGAAAMLEAETKTVALIDCDMQSTGGMTDWMNLIPEEDTEDLFFTRCHPTEVKQTIVSAEEVDRIYVDTPGNPVLNEMLEIAQVSDLVVVTGGHGAELRPMSQTMDTIKASCSTPVMGCLTKVIVSSIPSALAAIDWLISEGHDVFNSPVRYYSALDYARRDGVAPFKTSVSSKLRGDVSGLIKHMNRRLKNA